MNVEYQVMRKHTKSYELIPFFDNSDKLTAKRIYDFLDNRKLICDYLTSKVFRLVEPHEPGKNDSNKSRRDLLVHSGKHFGAANLQIRTYSGR